MRREELFPNSQWLMCEPHHFDVRYQINPWMDIRRTPERTLAWIQWTDLHHVLLRFGAWIEYVQQDARYPDMVFTANAGLVQGKTVVMSRFRHHERQGEEGHFRQWFEHAGYKIGELSTGFFEGEGDALFMGNVLFGGYGFRTDQAIYEELPKFFEISDLVQLQLLDSRFYHLDTCFAPLRKGLVMLYPGAFRAQDLKTVEKHAEIIMVPERDAQRFACNCVVLGDHIVMPAGCDETMKALAAKGFTVTDVCLDEFMKAGGAAKCLTIRIA